MVAAIAEAAAEVACIGSGNSDVVVGDRDGKAAVAPMTEAAPAMGVVEVAAVFVDQFDLAVAMAMATATAVLRAVVCSHNE